MSLRTMPEPFFVGSRNPIRIGLLEFSRGPCQDCSTETSACQPGSKNFIALGKGLREGVQFRAAVLEEFGGTVVGISKETTQFARVCFFFQPFVKEAYPFLLANDVEGSFSYPVGHLCFFKYVFIGLGQAGKARLQFPDQAKGFFAFLVSGCVLRIDQVMLDPRIEDPNHGSGGEGEGREIFLFTVNRYEMILPAVGRGGLIKNSARQADKFVFSLSAHPDQILAAEFLPCQLRENEGCGELKGGTRA